MASTSLGVLHILEAVRKSDPTIRLFNAGSGECFGDTKGAAADENTAFRPRSPYAVGKAAAFWQAVANYRRSLRAVRVLRHPVQSRIAPAPTRTLRHPEDRSTACRISPRASGERLELGNIDIARDWGWAPEYVDAMWLMLQQESARDLVLATGETRPLADFVDEVFAALGLAWRDHVKSDPALLRPTDVPSIAANPRRAMETLGWKAGTRMAGVAKKMVEAERNRLAGAQESKEQEDR